MLCKTFHIFTAFLLFNCAASCTKKIQSESKEENFVTDDGTNKHYLLPLPIDLKRGALRSSQMCWHYTKLPATEVASIQMLYEKSESVTQNQVDSQALLTAMENDATLKEVKQNWVNVAAKVSAAAVTVIGGMKIRPQLAVVCGIFRISKLLTPIRWACEYPGVAVATGAAGYYGAELLLDKIDNGTFESMKTQLDTVGATPIKLNAGEFFRMKTIVQELGQATAGTSSCLSASELPKNNHYMMLMSKLSGKVTVPQPRSLYSNFLNVDGTNK